MFTQYDFEKNRFKIDGVAETRNETKFLQSKLFVSFSSFKYQK
jgi:hypothetical protein